MRLRRYRAICGIRLAYGPSVMRRGGARHSAEVDGEMALTRKADRLRNIGDRLVGVAQQLASLLNAPFDHEAVRGPSRHCLERPAKMMRRQARYSRKLGEA